MELYRIGKTYKFFLKQTNSYNRPIYYLAKVVGREGNKLIIIKDGKEKQLDIDAINESELVGDSYDERN